VRHHASGNAALGGYEELDGLNGCKSSRQGYAPSRQLYRHITGPVALWHLPRVLHSNTKTSMARFPEQRFRSVVCEPVVGPVALWHLPRLQHFNAKKRMGKNMASLFRASHSPIGYQASGDRSRPAGHALDRAIGKLVALDVHGVLAAPGRGPGGERRDCERAASRAWRRYRAASVPAPGGIAVVAMHRCARAESVSASMPHRTTITAAASKTNARRCRARSDSEKFEAHRRSLVIATRSVA
jgi:hypothetical protein